MIRLSDAANMILSGVSGQLGTLEKEAVEQQLKECLPFWILPKKICESCYYIFGLQIEGRSLVEGLEVIRKS